MGLLKVRSPRDILRFIKLYKLTRSWALSKFIFSNGHMKTVLKFSEKGEINSSNGVWIAKFKSQAVLINLLRGDDFFILEELEKFEESGWKIAFEENGNILITSPLRIFHIKSYGIVRAMGESFIDYKDINVQDKFVLDIGAFLGDTALYFLGRGAKGVLALEPYEEFYKIATNNLYQNIINEEVKIFNVGIGNQVNQYDSNKNNSYNGRLFSFMDLKDQVEICNPENLPIFLKMDCEGCEYDVFRNPESILGWRSLGINEFIMEYHKGNIFDLIENFRNAGYMVKKLLVKSDDIGIIYGVLDPKTKNFLEK